MFAYIKKNLALHDWCQSKRLLQEKDFEKYAHEDSYKEKKSTPRKRGQPFTTIKSPNTLTNEGTYNSPRLWNSGVVNKRFL